MIFKWTDKLIDKKVAQLFNFFRKVGRRSELSYYTAYKDWLMYTARRSKDVSVKITLCTVAVCFVYITNGLKRSFNNIFEENSLSLSEMEYALEKFNETGIYLEDDQEIFITNYILNPKNELIFREFLQQRDK